MLNHAISPQNLKLFESFNEYKIDRAPFMHEQFAQWSKEQPLLGLKVLHHVPVVMNTLLKIACLIVAGAEVTVTNPSFMTADPRVLDLLNQDNIRYVSDLSALKGEVFDVYFDCGAELYQALGAPRLGAIELTASGDHYYREQLLSFPVVTIDPTLTKQLETVFGAAESCQMAIEMLTHVKPHPKSWVVFGFGKIGRGLAYSCVNNNTNVVVVELLEEQRRAAEKMGIHAIAPDSWDKLKLAISQADIVVTATGGKGILNHYPREWFDGKILANMGVYDEFGVNFSEQAVLNQKKPVNFVLNDPTPMQYIDPEFYIHNKAVFDLLKNKLSPGVHRVQDEVDQDIISRWCQFHSVPLDVIRDWFIATETMSDNQTQQAPSFVC